MSISARQGSARSWQYQRSADGRGTGTTAQLAEQEQQVRPRPWRHVRSIPRSLGSVMTSHIAAGLLVGLFCFTGACAMARLDAPVGSDKKIVEWGWDQPDTNCLREHIREVRVEDSIGMGGLWKSILLIAPKAQPNAVKDGA